MAIRELADGRFVIDVYSKSGRRMRAIYACTIQEAQDIETATLIRLGKAKKTKTIAEFAPQYLTFCERQKGYSYKKNVVNMLAREFGHLRLDQIQTFTVEQYQTKLLKSGISPSTINRRVATLKHMITKASDWNLVDDTSLKAVRRPKMLKETTGRLRFLTIAEAETLLRCCKESRAGHLYGMVQVALNTGMRLGEIIKLRWEHVDLANNIITIVSGSAKNSQRRDIPMNAIMRSTFTAMPRPISGGKVFGVGCIKTGWKVALRRSGIKDFRFHDLRHTFASWLVQRGVDLTTLQKLLGHKSFTMTLRYAHLAPEHFVAAVSVLDKPVVNVVNGNTEQ